MLYYKCKQNKERWKTQTNIKRLLTCSVKKSKKLISLRRILWDWQRLNPSLFTCIECTQQRIIYRWTLRWNVRSKCRHWLLHRSHITRTLCCSRCRSFNFSTRGQRSNYGKSNLKKNKKTLDKLSKTCYNINVNKTKRDEKLKQT